MCLYVKSKQIFLTDLLISRFFVRLKHFFNITLWSGKYLEFLGFNQIVVDRHLFQILLKVVSSLVYKLRLHIVAHPSFAWQLRDWNAWPVFLELFMQSKELLKSSFTSPNSFWINATALINNMVTTKLRIDDAKLTFFCIFKNIVCIL